MPMKTLLRAPVVAGFLVTCSLALAAEPASVTVKLSDAANGKMSLALSPSTVAPGPVEFTIKNASHTLKHEFLILPWTASDAALPYDTKTQQVEEDKLKGLEGVEDLKPRETVTARFVLKPGRYVVFCNEPGHYRDDMRTSLVVSDPK